MDIFRFFVFYGISYYDISLRIKYGNQIIKFHILFNIHWFFLFHHVTFQKVISSLLRFSHFRLLFCTKAKGWLCKQWTEYTHAIKLSHRKNKNEIILSFYLLIMCLNDSFASRKEYFIDVALKFYNKKHFPFRILKQ